MVSAAVEWHHHDHGPSCYSTCPSDTDLSVSSNVLTFGQEQTEVFSVTVSPKFGTGTPTGTVLVAWQSTVLCQITLASGAGSCSPTASALPAGHRAYRIRAYYQGDTNFTGSQSHSQKVKVEGQGGNGNGNGNGNGDGDGDGDGGGHGHHGHGNDQGGDGQGGDGQGNDH